MYPKLFEIPFVHLTVWSYGLMMVIGFLSAVYLIRHLSKNITLNPNLITNAALYSLIAGLLGARFFYVIHYFDQFRGNMLSVFAIWEGSGELLGGVVAAILVIFFYLKYHKLPIRHYLDILAIALMLALMFGRVGCFFSGCCFGKPTNATWGVRFPYGSRPYRSQVYPDLDRSRHQPHLNLPTDFFGYYNEAGQWIQDLKPFSFLTEEQKKDVLSGPYRCVPVHPTQLYSSAGAAVCCLILYLFWRRSQRYSQTRWLHISDPKRARKLFTKSGSTFGLMFVLYGTMRFFIEFLRDDNPFEFNGLTVSQNISIGLLIWGAVLMIIIEKIRPEVVSR
jgi:phosphatidylglycerol:prolipoprotein diacylglycerol transferase